MTTTLSFSTPPSAAPHLGRELTAQAIATAAHELRGPLTVILGHLDLLIHPRGDHSLDVALEAIRRNADRMLSTVTTVLDDMAPGAAAPLPLASLCRDIIADCGLTHPHRRIGLYAQGDVVAAADRFGVERVVNNLVRNALTHTPLGCKIDIAVVGCDDPGMVALLVIDDGPGIAADCQQLVFEPFQRAHTVVDGAGLGLHIAREIARSNGGDLLLHDDAGRGCCFELRLPRGSRGG